ncbi:MULTISPECIES: cell division protein SepF [Thermoactinomyces]|jgi:cell division inhibitor SepF|uniref:Cell division protein SepF n=1 Tax=Thermoactinomyces daqus TaxID=1329516 RepID=A0A7W1X9H1_9BACL|nr:MULTISPECIES: cell division protein SepF [Thermoactinomyces]MBA4542526.1 cell division protein SepF [Thermoactinomyces daqus]MBH8598074.1 cell division protein SepF [Thermoactinomyces sp. CICC 10523]MBH8603105.1 cell division protein SepF [Thermoactinomyces sp. CICC 10522]MBH8607088.1 cell division protein SepF [Thermoactinomyces sp. CICC 10521]
MTFMDRIMGFFGVTDEDLYEEETKEQDESAPSVQKGRSNIVSLHTQKNIRLVLFEPKTYEESPEIADHLKSHRPVVVNLQLVRRDQGIRIIDFLSGTVYALGGNIQKLGNNIFICTPANVDIQGTITDFLREDEAKDLR